MDKSEKALPAESIDGGAAGQFVKADNKESKEGAILYLHIQKDKGEVTFYVSAKISLLKILYALTRRDSGNTGESAKGIEKRRTIC
ncbi:hypothetical protein [Bacteroides fluxus]|uniref:Conserved domain protein n=1 Tax=Bacteroides fluxus YIT 12057 TaxID=763034 RepID=F3PY40_9BACE|nr:hypothetical protein [Bacteroides fluxus]EGF51008.1 conserved domain protein [Bacteroides fluxus YIT 12057]MDY3788905.1 hypothetical protein [Bacteroides fluxus]